MGVNTIIDLFDVDVNVVAENEIVRGFNYSNCRVIDYVVASDMNVEETYTKKIFALENTFELECQGYHSNNPWLDKMFDVSISKTKSSLDLENTYEWPDGFYVKKETFDDKKQQLLFQEQKARYLLEKTYLQARY